MMWRLVLVIMPFMRHAYLIGCVVPNQTMNAQCAGRAFLMTIWPENCVKCGDVGSLNVYETAVSQYNPNVV